MKKLVAIFAIIALSAVAFAQDGQGAAAVGSAGTPVSYRPLGNASQGAIDAAVQYIKLKLGERYYNQYISFSSGNLYEECTGCWNDTAAGRNDTAGRELNRERNLYEECAAIECANKSRVFFIYNIPVNITTVASADAEISRSPGLWPPLIWVVLDDKNTVIEYRGPSKPYKFLLSADDAIAKARAYGLRNVTYATIAISQLVAGGYDVVWAVGSNDLAGECRDIGAVQECIYRGVYVDVDNGDVVGEFRINPLIQYEGGGGGVPIPPKGEAQRQDNTYAYAATAITALIALAAAVLFAIKRRKAQ